MNNEMTTDNMSNEEVIEVLKGIVFGGFDRTTRKERQALDLAIKALEERPQGEMTDEVWKLTDEVWKLYKKHQSHLATYVLEFGEELADLLGKYNKGGAE